jgi:hypothetical protein
MFAFTADTNLSFVDMFSNINVGTSTPKGYNSPDSNHHPASLPKMFENFQVIRNILFHSFADALMISLAFIS